MSDRRSIPVRGTPKDECSLDEAGARQDPATVEGLPPSGDAICELVVGGMDCPSCADDIRRSIGRLQGIERVDVDVVGGKVRVALDEGSVTRAEIASAIREAGYPVEDRDARRLVFTVEGMDCADEIRQLEGTVGRLEGVTNVSFDLVRRRMVVAGSRTAVEIQRAVKASGMTAHPEGETERTLTFWERRGRLVVTVASGVLLAAGVALDWLGASDRVTVPMLALAAISGGWFIAPRGWRAARAGALDMNFLMTTAAIGAAVIGEWGEGASAIFLFSVAQLLETFSMDRARNAIKAMMDLSPSEASVRRDGREQTIPVAEVSVGETIIVRPGQRIPLDGVVSDGRSAVNQAPITGESLPVEKETGAEVFAGSINEHGLLEIRVTKLVEDTTLARIIHSVEEAQASRAPSQSFVDRFSRVYTPAVVALAVLVFILPPLLGLGGWDVWFYRALAMLVIACPCALVISTPVSIVSGLAAAALGGVLIKGGAHLETAGAVTTVAFDKTGTLTEGRPSVTDVFALGDLDESEIIGLAAAVERGSEHPLARAVLARIEADGIEPPLATEFEALMARGVRARVGDRLVFVGNERLARENGTLTAAAAIALERFESEGKTSVLVSIASEPVGVIAIADTVRAEAPAALQALRDTGVRRILMLTGDNEGTARAVAGRLGVDAFHAELMPDDKVRIVRDLEASGERVAFVGDGVNDAPALAAATVGVAMGAAGSDVALETADIALMGDDLSRLPFAVHLSRTTLGIIRQNIWFSIAIKGVFLVLALVGWATLWMAVASDMGASLLVVLNGLRALRVR